MEQDKVSHFNTNRIQVKMVETEKLSNLVQELTVMDIPFRATSTIVFDPHRMQSKTLSNHIEIMKLSDEQTVQVAELMKLYGLEYMLSLNSVHGAKEE